MTDPRRLVDDDDVARLLLGSASDDLPSAASRARARHAVLAATMIGVGAGASAGIAASGAQAATKAAGWVFAKWFILAALPLAVVTGSYIVGSKRDNPASTSVASASPKKAVTGAPPLAASVDLRAPPMASSSSPSPEQATPLSATQRTPPARVAPTSLQAEITEFDAARLALAHGDGSVLDRYLTEHPKGALREQALWMKISSLEQSGRKVEATAFAKRLLAAYPNGTFAARARVLSKR